MNETDLPDDRSPSTGALTRIQQQVLDATVFLIGKGELPTIREVASLVGRAPATVLKHLRFLERHGFLSLSGKSRGIRIANPDLLREVVSHEPGADVLLQTHLAGIANLGESDGSGGAERSTHDPSTPIHISKGTFRRYGRLTGRAVNSGAIPLVGAIAAGRPFESYPESYESYETDVAEPPARRPEDSAPSPGDSGSSDGSGTHKTTGGSGAAGAGATPSLGVDPRLFVESGDLVALRVEGDSMVRAGILDGDYVIVRRQNCVEEGEIAAVLIDGEGTLKRWRTRRDGAEDRDCKDRDGAEDREARVSLQPENDMFEPIEISAADAKEVLVFGKYVGLIRGNLQLG